MQKHQKALGRCNRQGSKHELDSAQQSLTNIIQKNPELVTLKISVYKIATATWLLWYWPICRRCCRVLAAKKQEQTWEISLKYLRGSANIASLHWKAVGAIVFHTSCLDVSRQKTPVHLRCPLVLIFQKVFFHPDFPHLPPQQSSCEQIYNEYAELPDHKSQGIIQ